MREPNPDGHLNCLRLCLNLHHPHRLSSLSKCLGTVNGFRNFLWICINPAYHGRRSVVFGRRSDHIEFHRQRGFRVIWRIGRSPLAIQATRTT
jgi:hypothetical protein